jgi:glucan biosynthesis protein C
MQRAPTTDRTGSHARSEARATPPPVVAPHTGRLLFVDNLRVALTTLVVLHHLAVTYAGLPIWYYVEPPPESLSLALLILVVLFNQAFFMGLFFLIAGYFTPGAYDRKGPRAFLLDRLARLGIPLLLFVAVLGPISFLYRYQTEIVAKGVDLPYGRYYLATLGPGPLWFVEALLIFAALYALGRRLSRTPAGPARRLADSSLPGVRAVVAFILGLTLATFLVRLWAPLGWPLPILGFPTTSHIAQYVALFIVGTLAFRRNWLVRVPKRAGLPGFGAATVATLTVLPLALTDSTAMSGGPHWQAFAYALWESIVCVGMSLGLVSLFRRCFDRQGPLASSLSAQAYTVFLVHAPVITGVGVALRDLHLDPLLKFMMASLIGVPLCFLVAGVVRRLPLLRRVL